MVEEPVHVDEQVNMDNLAHDDNPPSPARTSGPMQEPVIDTKMTIVGEKHSTPEASNTLAKFVAKDEPVMLEKGKTKLELPRLDRLSVTDLHQQYLTRLSESRDAKASMINMLKRKYEV